MKEGGTTFSNENLFPVIIYIFDHVPCSECKHYVDFNLLGTKKLKR